MFSSLASLANLARWSSFSIMLCSCPSICVLAEESTESNAGQDRVILGPALPRSTNLWNPPPSIVLVGKVDSLDDHILEMTLSNGERRKLPSDRVEQIDVAWANAAAAKAHARFAQRRYIEALKENDDLLSAGGFPMWQQRILLAELVESAEAIGKVELSGQLFLELAKRSAPDYLLATVPLNWTSRELSPTLRKTAGQWLVTEDDFAGLLGASWLLLSDKADESKKRLQKIQASRSKVLQRLAAMQLWRAIPPSESTEAMSRWFVARDSLSLPMQLGPTEFMAERFAKIEKLDLAIGEWLRIAASHAHHPHRASQALNSAQSYLSRSGKQAAANKAAEWLLELTP